MRRAMIILFMTLILSIDYSKPIEYDYANFMSAVKTYIIVDIATQDISDDLLSIKIVEMLGRSPKEIYDFIYNETNGDVPFILKEYYETPQLPIYHFEVQRG